ncbi:MAG: hypothetical protein ABI045_01250 [Flavobacteriales bacterium]
MKPFTWAKLETEARYSLVCSRKRIDFEYIAGDQHQLDPQRSNAFDYDE